MLDALRFVAAAIAKKDYVAELTHFKIKDERVTGFNGVIALSSDIEVDLNAYPNATRFMAAIRACPDTISLHVTPAGKLAVKSGSFKSYVDCLPDDNGVFVEPEGEEIEVGKHFLPGIKTVAPLMGIDASRPWAMGIRLSGNSLLVTNNTMLAEYWTGEPFPVDVVIPALAVEQLIRINENPTKIQLTKNAISFWFGEKRWMKSSLVDSHYWPDAKVKTLFDKATPTQSEFAEGLFEAVERLKPFLEDSGTIYMDPEKVSTSQSEGEGTSIELTTGVSSIQAYHYRNLMLLGEVAKTIDWGTYPNPCHFMSDRLRGVIIGQRVN